MSYTLIPPGHTEGLLLGSGNTGVFSGYEPDVYFALVCVCVCDPSGAYALELPIYERLHAPINCAHFC